MRFYYDHEYEGTTTEDVQKVELGLDVIQAMDWENGTTWPGVRTLQDEEQAEIAIATNAAVAEAIAHNRAYDAQQAEMEAG